MKKYNITSKCGLVTVSRKVGKKILEIDSTRPNIIYLQYCNGWKSTSGIRYSAGKYGFDTPSLWNKKVLGELDDMYEFVSKIFSQI